MTQVVRNFSDQLAKALELRRPVEEVALLESSEEMRDGEGQDPFLRLAQVPWMTDLQDPEHAQKGPRRVERHHQLSLRVPTRRQPL